MANTVKGSLDLIDNAIIDNKMEINSSILNSAQEGITHGLVNTNSDHSAIHKGYGMCVHLNYASLGAGLSKTYRIKGPSTLYAHIKSIQISLEGATCKAELIKDATITNVGTEITGVINNLNHNYSTSPQSKIYDGSVTYTGGTVWCSAIAYGDTSGAGGSLVKVAGQFIQNENIEYITKSGNTDYILKITNLSSSDATTNLNINMFFYEEPAGLI